MCRRRHGPTPVTINHRHCAALRRIRIEWSSTEGYLSTAVALQAGNLATLSTIAGRIACAFYIVSDAVALADDPNIENLAGLAVDAASCGVTPKFGRPKPKPATCKAPNSFDGDTMVWIKEGLKQIKDIEVGEQVLAWDPITIAPVLKPVVGLSSRIAVGDVYRLILSDAAGKHSTTTVTGNHPYLLAANENQPPLLLAADDNGSNDPTILHIAPGGAWKIVRYLKPGDRVRTALNGAVIEKGLIHSPTTDFLTVISIDLEHSPRRVYNFEVEGLYSYAVGALGEWVHNAGWPTDKLNNIMDQIIKREKDLKQDACKLPEFGPGPDRSSRLGHRRIIRRLWIEFYKRLDQL